MLMQLKYFFTNKSKVHEPQNMNYLDWVLSFSAPCFIFFLTAFSLSLTALVACRYFLTHSLWEKSYLIVGYFIR